MITKTSVFARPIMSSMIYRRNKLDSNFLERWINSMDAKFKFWQYSKCNYREYL